MDEPFKLKYLLLCKDVKEHKDGALDFLGVLDTFVIPGDKPAVREFKIVASFDLGEAIGYYNFDLVAHAPTGEILDIGTIQAGYVNGKPYGVISPTVLLALKPEGIYTINLLYQDRILGQTSFQVWVGELLSDA